MNPDETPVTPEITDPVPPQGTPDPELEKNFKSALAQKEHFREKFEKAEAERKALEAKLNESVGKPSTGLKVEDFIDISASLDGLDPREKAFLAEQHKLSGQSLKELRESENFQLWQSAYRAKQEKENALRPNSTQPNDPPPKSFAQKLQEASLEEKEKLLREAGLYKEFRPRADRTKIGT